MNRQLNVLILSSLCTLASHAQGTIDFMNRNIPGANGGPNYNNPIWSFGKEGIEGAGMLPGGVTVGLFEQASNVPLVSTPLRTDTPQNAAFFAISTQTATTSSAAGSTPTLFVRAWQTAAGSFTAAQSSGLYWDQWSFTTQPLGGTPPGGGLPVPTPGMTGWIVPEPSAIGLGILGVGALFTHRRARRC